MSRPPIPPVTRRGVLLGAGALGAAGAAGAFVSACSGADTADSGGDTSSAAAAPVEVSTADVPVGGGVVLRDAKVVVTQPQPGQYHGFSAVCTHRGCLVADVADGLIHCPCHGSEFSDVDGAVEHGPATEPLPARTVTVNGATLTVD
ncbi:QcrA and Rieske domain-containing protein [Mycolicibacterium palauense]|uniref:QcrA and Rieske domain-containing protein n=1 Tax=Mycolicibacterium palauense TaxID=2034511 RepID=UPI000BFEAA7B|nr:Rieske (2Fe-2S) protein [Mycolicibacterium palauense]